MGQVAATKQAATGGCFGCFEGQQDKEKAMKAQVEKLQQELLASQEAVTSVRSRAESAQQEVGMHKTKSQQERKEMLKQTAIIKPAPTKAPEVQVQRTLSINSM